MTNPLLDPKEIDIAIDGFGAKTFRISRFPAIAGREIVTQYPMSGIPKIGQYSLNEELMLKMLSYVEVKSGDAWLRLTTRDLIDNHVPHFEMLMKLEMAMMEHNCTFFQNGKVKGLLAQVLEMAREWTSKSLTDFAARSFQKD